MLSADQLLILAIAYQEATGAHLRHISQLATQTKNDKTFLRLQEGKGCSTRTINQAARWFVANWPEGLAWPSGVPAPAELRAKFAEADKTGTGQSGQLEAAAI